jgi:hypothetical protein
MDCSEPGSKAHLSPIELPVRSVDKFAMRDVGAMPEPATSIQGSNSAGNSEARALVAAWLPFLKKIGLKGQIDRSRLRLGIRTHHVSLSLRTWTTIALVGTSRRR